MSTDAARIWGELAFFDAKRFFFMLFDAVTFAKPLCHQARVRYSIDSPLKAVSAPGIEQVPYYAMLQAAPRRLFPLHLATIDSFFLLDDRPDYPMTFASNLFFTGEFDRNAFQAALDDALLLHPLLHALIGPGKQGKICWLDAGAYPTTPDWGGLEAPIDIESRAAINLTQEPGLRTWVRQGNGKAKLLLQFHHACCDGTGAHRFMGDLLAGYGIRTATGGRQPEVANYDPQLLKGRSIKLAEQYISGSFFRNARQTLSHSVQVFGRKIAPLAKRDASLDGETLDGPVAALPVALPGVVSQTFDREQHKRLRAAAGEMGVMLNDLLLAEMFQAMKAWNFEQGGPRRQRLRIMMPSDMRNKSDYAMPAANMTSYNFITRHTNECEDNARLVRSIRDETALIKNEQRGRRFIDSISAASKYAPGILPYLLSKKRCLSTVTVSHLGDPTKRFLATFPRVGGKLLCGDVVLDNMVGVSPLRPQTRAAVAIVTLYRELTINVRCDPHEMSLADTQRFLDIFTARLQSQLP